MNKKISEYEVEKYHIFENMIFDDGMKFIGKIPVAGTLLTSLYNFSTIGPISNAEKETDAAISGLNIAYENGQYVIKGKIDKPINDVSKKTIKFLTSGASAYNNLSKKVKDAIKDWYDSIYKSSGGTYSVDYGSMMDKDNILTCGNYNPNLLSLIGHLLDCINIFFYGGDISGMSAEDIYDCVYVFNAIDAAGVINEQMTIASTKSY